MSRYGIAVCSLCSLLLSSLLEVVLVEAGEVDLLDVSHVEDVLEEGEVAEHILVGHLDGEGSLGSDALHCNYRIDKIMFIMPTLGPD